MNGQVNRFEDLEVWKISIKLATDLYRQLKDCRDFSLRDQLQRSAVSIPSNISEGYDRKTNKEFIYFLYVAKGSCSELRTQLFIAIETAIIPKEIGKEFIETTKYISSMLHNYIKIRKEKF